MTDSHRPAAVAALWDTNSETDDVKTASAEDATPQQGSGSGSLGSSSPSQGFSGAGNDDAADTDDDDAELSGEQLAAFRAHARESGSGRNVTVLPLVESSGERIQLRPRSETRYQRVRRLGAGAMGEVSLVRDNDIGRSVAIKQLAKRTQNAGGIARFIEEIRTIGRLEHPNIVPIHDVGIDEEGQIFFVMKHIDGETLETIIGRLAKNDPEYLKRYPLDVRVELFQGLLRALQFAHSHGIIHRNARAEISVEKLQSEGCAASVRN